MYGESDENMPTKKFCENVVRWFRENGRTLPWRVGRDPYRIWISEIMLQQTRIEAVIPYYHRFLLALPDIAALASCPEDELLKLWEGLGYYSRARNLKKAAIAVMENFGGDLPSEASDLKKLPGIGDYTAGAISSIAFGKSEPAVDGNVLRVVTRYLGDFSDIMLPLVRKGLSEKLREVYPEGAAAADLTEGIMELGERICIPNGAPQCCECPLREECVARKEGLWEKIPVKTPKAERKKIPMTVFVLCCGDRFALRKRGDKGLLSGMWEFYHTEGNLSEKDALAHLLEKGFSVEQMKKIGSAKHIFTHLEWEMRGFLVTLSEEEAGFVWASAEEIASSFAIPTAFSHYRKQIK